MKRLLLAMIVLMATIAPTLALETQAISSKRAVATLVTDTDAMQPNTPFRIALRLRMAEGWHTYWKNPGDAGVPPALTIDGAQQSPIDWPTPRRVAEGPVMTYAYTGEVLLPVTVTMTTGAIKAHAEWLVCKDICVPEEGDFSLNLPIGKPGPSAQAGLFAAHDRAVPRASPWTENIAADGTLSVQGPELSKTTVAAAWFIPNDPNRIQDDAKQTLSVREGGFTLALKPAPGFAASKPLRGVLSVRDRAGLQTDVVVDAVPGAAPAAVVSQFEPPPLGRVLLFAFLGGLILNLMPCVFPVLAMKAVGLARHAGKGHAHAVSYTAGVLVTFMALAGALLATRAAGNAAGWGFQFSSPLFVTGMTWLLFAVGLNLSGVFTVGSGLAGTGSGLAERHGTTGSFFTGLLAVLVATPCTAPFMGVAVAAGLASPPLTTLLVFAVMGLGLAAPYVALATMPGLAGLMPRPGRWMDILKQVLAFPMYGAAAWLAWVVSQEAGPAGVLAMAAGLVLIGFAGWVFGTTQMFSLNSQRVGQAVALCAVLAALAILSGISTAPPGAATETSAETFTPQRLAALRQTGRPVFVNMTASWCVTCLVNERLAISTDAVKKAFATNDVSYLKGDWTRQDPAITAFLRHYGRDGVPLYVFFPAHDAKPLILPQILTESEVLGLLKASQ